MPGKPTAESVTRRVRRLERVPREPAASGVLQADCAPVSGPGDVACPQRTDWPKPRS
jgi:hypothetical protein